MESKSNVTEYQQQLFEELLELCHRHQRDDLDSLTRTCLYGCCAFVVGVQNPWEKASYDVLKENKDNRQVMLLMFFLDSFSGNHGRMQANNYTRLVADKIGMLEEYDVLETLGGNILNDNLNSDNYPKARVKDFMQIPTDHFRRVYKEYRDKIKADNFSVEASKPALDEFSLALFKTKVDEMKRLTSADALRYLDDLLSSKNQQSYNRYNDLNDEEYILYAKYINILYSKVKVPSKEFNKMLIEFVKQAGYHSNDDGYEITKYLPVVVLTSRTYGTVLKSVDDNKLPDTLPVLIDNYWFHLMLQRPLFSLVSKEPFESISQIPTDITTNPTKFNKLSAATDALPLKLLVLNELLSTLSGRYSRALVIKYKNMVVSQILSLTDSVEDVLDNSIIILEESKKDLNKALKALKTSKEDIKECSSD